MRVHVFLTAFHAGDRDNVPERPVEVPDVRVHSDNRGTVLESVFANGQNDVQSLPGFRSVSAGDVVDLRLAGEGCWRVVHRGFVRLADDEDPTELIGLAACDAGYGITRGHSS